MHSVESVQKRMQFFFLLFACLLVCHCNICSVLDFKMNARKLKGFQLVMDSIQWIQKFSCLILPDLIGFIVASQMCWIFKLRTYAVIIVQIQVFFHSQSVSVCVFDYHPFYKISDISQLDFKLIQIQSLAYIQLQTGRFVGENETKNQKYYLFNLFPTIFIPTAILSTKKIYVFIATYHQDEVTR